MLKKSSMCILLRDEMAEVAFIDYTILGGHVKFTERLPRDEHLYEAVAGLMRSAAKTPARVTLCVPRGSVMQRTLRYPAAVQNDIAGMIQLEATRHVPLPETDRALGWSAVPTPDEKQLTLNLVAARQSEIRALNGRFRAAGVPIDEAVPLSSALSDTLGSAPTLLALADSRSVELCLYGEGQLQDSQLMDRAAPDFDSERVVNATRQMAAKHKAWLGDEGIGRIIKAGAADLPDMLETELETAFGVRVRALNLPGGLVGASVGDEFIEVVLAAASDLPPELNLARTSDRKVPVSKRTVMISALVLVLLLEVVAGYAFYTTAPARQRKRVASEVSSLRRRSANAIRLKERNRELRRQLFWMEDISRGRVSVMAILKDLSEAVPEDTYLRALTYRGGEGVRMTGYSKDPERLPELLEALPMVDMISSSDIEREINDYHEFKLSITLRSPDEEDDA